jgi:hypothetical protein
VYRVLQLGQDVCGGSLADPLDDRESVSQGDGSANLEVDDHAHWEGWIATWCVIRGGKAQGIHWAPLTPSRPGWQPKEFKDVSASDLACARPAPPAQAGRVLRTILRPPARPRGSSATGRVRLPDGICRYDPRRPRYGVLRPSPSVSRAPTSPSRSTPGWDERIPIARRFLTSQASR